MKTPLILLFFALLLFNPSISFADTGNDLVQNCNEDLLNRFDDNNLTSAEQFKVLRCITFVEGVMNGYDAGFFKGLTYASNKIVYPDPKNEEKLLLKFKEIGTNSDEGLGFCEPKGAVNIQYAKVVAKYLRENPQKLDQVAVNLVLAALQDAFPPPCLAK